jgi:hypothetical protein
MVSIYAIVNLYKKNRIYEEWVISTRDSINELHENIQELDSRQLFEKDDDVGVIYEGIKDLIVDLNEKISEE